MTPSPDGGEPQLTSREREALAASATGLAVAQLADRLGQTVEVVRRLLESATTKLGVRPKLEAVVVALRAGLIELPAP